MVLLIKKVITGKLYLLVLENDYLKHHSLLTKKLIKQIVETNENAIYLVLKRLITLITLGGISGIDFVRRQYIF